MDRTVLDKADAVQLEQPAEIKAWMTFLLATSCGLIVANLYYAQPLIALIAPSIGLSKTTAGLIVTLTQIGYCAGLLLLVPLGDLVENRKLVLVTLSAAILALVAAALAPNAPLFLTASLLIGIGSVTVQMLVPIASHMASDANRGRVVGNVVSGLLVGIMLARPVSSMMADAFGWRAIYFVSAVVLVGLGAVLRLLLPARTPEATHTYSSLIRSLVDLLKSSSVLQRRAAYQAAMFGCFSLYWTAVPLELAGPTFGFSQKGIALFALLGATGALSAPIAGRVADRGWTKMATGVSLAAVAVSFLLAKWGGTGSLVALLAAGILLDLGVQSNLVLGQRAIYGLGAATRSRLNGLYMAIFFLGGAIGSALSSVTFANGGWVMVSWVGLGFSGLALLFYATEFTKRR